MFPAHGIFDEQIGSLPRLGYRISLCDDSAPDAAEASAPVHGGDRGRTGFHVRIVGSRPEGG